MPTIFVYSIGQCYDGAAAMKGHRSGLKTRLQAENPKAIYVHCYAHTLQLAVQDACRLAKTMENAMDIASAIGKLIGNSPNRDVKFKQLQSAQIDGPKIGIRTLCPTRYVLML